MHFQFYKRVGIALDNQMMSGIGSSGLVLRPSYPIFPNLRIKSNFSILSSPAFKPDVDSNALLSPLEPRGMFMQAPSTRTRPIISLQAAHKNVVDHPTVLDIIVPTNLSTLTSNLISDTHSGLLVQLHQALESENFSIQFASPLSVPHHDALTEAAKDIHLVLNFTTPLPIASLKAQNTEKVHLQRKEASSYFTISSTCSTMGVPLGNCFLNKLEWHAEAIGANQTHLTIKGMF